MLILFLIAHAQTNQLNYWDPRFSDYYAPITANETNFAKGAITSEIKHATENKSCKTCTTERYAVIGCKLKQNANAGCNSCATVVQVLQDLFYVLLHVLFYL